ncbi:MAG: Gfo/Idh/MocA family oxidoreductase [Bacteroidales bacterium]|nr:Gfo/Idh/MocA family oxidoreductase [Bacteroidales bacterium]
MLKIGVLGAGHLGKIHIKCIKQIDRYELVGFYDPDAATAKAVEAEMGVRCFDTLEVLIDAVEVVDIVTPTVQHFACASKALQRRRHVFIEKPIVATPDEAAKLVKLADEAGVKVQVGHVERFNPAFIAAEPFIKEPKFIEAHRLALFNPRGTDVPVVLDLMVHDLDILTTIIDSPVTSVSACGVAIVSPTPDITNARIEFENGSVANLTASRISLKNMRKTRIFQKDAYITVDFLEKKSEIARIHDHETSGYPYSLTLDLADGETRQITLEKLEIQPLNAIQKELESFYDSIIHNTTPVVSIQDGVKVLNLAYEILKKEEERSKKQENLPSGNK